jgi:ubiquinone/menaquinone biosynthesis C-methylase UbiE
MSTSRYHSVESAFVSHREQSNETQVLARAIRPLVKKASIVVDVGAGTGALAKALTGRRKIIAIEPSQAHFVKLSKSLIGHQHQLIHQRIETVQLSPRSVDAVLFSYSLYHFASLRSAVEKAFNWLKPGGIAIFVILAENGDQTVVIRRFWKQYHRHRDAFFPSGAQVKRVLREYTETVGSRRVTSCRTLRNERDRSAFLCLALEVAPHKLRMRTRLQFKRWLSRNVAAGQVTTNHEIIYCQKQLDRTDCIREARTAFPLLSRSGCP